MSIRYDRGEIKAKHLTEEGFLKVDAVVTRTGVFAYQNNDGSIRSELRHPDEVLNIDSLQSMELIPITLLHPREKIVDSKNAKQLMRGAVGQRITHDGRLIKANIVITDQAAIDAVQDGIQELSLGYSVNLVEDEGDYNGERHDFRQTDIKYNHLAIVPRGRAGEARIILDADDAAQYIDEGLPPTKKPQEKTNMKKVNIDGIEYEATPEVARHIEKLSKSVADSVTASEAFKVEKSEMQAKLDAASEKVASLEKVDHSAKIDEAVKSRIALVSSALKHLDAEGAKDIEAKTDSEIKLAVIKHYAPELNLDDKDAAYIQARFDIALESKVESKEDAALAAQRLKINNKDEGEKKELNADEAREAYIQYTKDLSKPKAKA